jgi:hypothetical protein
MYHKKKYHNNTFITENKNPFDQNFKNSKISMP